MGKKKPNKSAPAAAAPATSSTPAPQATKPQQPAASAANPPPTTAQQKPTPAASTSSPQTAKTTPAKSPSQPKTTAAAPSPSSATKKSASSTSSDSTPKKAKTTTTSNSSGKKKTTKKSKSKAQEDDDDADPVFKDLQLNEEEFQKFETLEQKKNVLSIPDPVGDSKVTIHMYGSASELGFGDKLKVGLSGLDSATFLMIRIEKTIRVPFMYWDLVLETVKENKTHKLLFMNGGELLHQYNFVEAKEDGDDEEEEEEEEAKCPKHKLYLLPKLPEDVRAFKKYWEGVQEADKEILASENRFFDLKVGSDLPWKERCQKVFKLFKDETEDEKKIQEEVEYESDDEEEEEVEEERKIIEIEDDEQFEKMELEYKLKKEKAQKAKLEAKKNKNSQEWEKYFEYRSKLIKDLEESMNGDEEEGVVVCRDVYKNIRHILSTTSYSQEIKDLFYNSIYLTSESSSWEDVDELRSLDTHTKIFSLYGNNRIDLNFSYHRRLRYYSMEFFISLGFELISPAYYIKSHDDDDDDSVFGKKDKTGQNIYNLYLSDDQHRNIEKWKYKEKRKYSLTLKHIKDIRKALFGNVKELNEGITDIQLMDLLCAATYANYRSFPEGVRTSFAADDYFGYNLRLTCRASTPKDEEFVERSEESSDDDDYEDYDDDDEDYDDDDDDEGYAEYFGNDDDEEINPADLCRQS